MTRRAAALVALALVAGQGCGRDELVLPSRTDAIVDEEQRVGALIELHERAGFSDDHGRCDVRILRMTEATSYAFAHCTWGQSGVSSAYRVDGSIVTGTQDGSAYAPSVHRLFPPDIATAILKDSERLRPLISAS